MKISKIIALVATSFCACVFGVCGCQSLDNNNDANSLDIAQVYELYVTYETAAGNDSPLTYEEWLLSIKGEKGDKGDKGDKGEDGANGTNGVNGEKGDKGDKGEKGDPGEKGEPGANGLNGEKGDKGEPGEKGDKGEKGDAGEKGEKGDAGENGADGKSAYQIWLDAGNVGSEQDFIMFLKGEKGDKGEKGEDGKDGVDGENGKDGVNGTNGIDGEDGKSAYQIWLEAGNKGTEADFIASLKGQKGDKGETGIKGDKGDKGEDGSDGASVVNAYIDDRMHLILVLSNNRQIDAGYVGVKVDNPVETNVYSVIFMVDGKIFNVVEYKEGDKSITEPQVPQKEGYTGKWSEYALSNKNIVVNAIYTEIIPEPEPIDPSEINPDDFKSDLQYVINVTSEGGRKLSDVKVSALHSSGTVLASGKTNLNGKVSFGLISGEYTISVDTSTLPAGYYLTEKVYKTDEARSEINYVIPSKIYDISENEAFESYSVGDIAGDFTLTQYGTNDKCTLSEMLKNKKAVVLVFFDPKDTKSKNQMGIIEQVYQSKRDDIQVVGIYKSGTGSSIQSFLEDYQDKNNDEMTMPLFEDKANLFNHYIVEQIPTTVIIDRYGMIAYKSETVESGSQNFEVLINTYIANGYKQNN